MVEDDDAMMIESDVMEIMGWRKVATISNNELSV